jgi:hypothetical protein
MEKRKKYRESIGRKTVTPGNLAEQVQYGKPVTNIWRTPDAHCDRGPSSEQRMKMKLDKKMPISLNDQVRHPDLMWPTPRAKEPGRTTKGYGRGLAELVEGKQQLWPTPSAGMWKQDVNDNGRYARDIQKKGYQIMLPAAIKLTRVPTPTARDYKDSGPNTNYEKARKKGRLAGSAGGSLNPTWVEWLMGYPKGWTDLKD